MSELGALAKVLRGRRIGHLGRKRKVRLLVFLFLHTRWCKQVLVILWVRRKTPGHSLYPDVPIWGITDTPKLGSTWNSISKEHFLFQIHTGTQSRFSSSASFSVLLPDHCKKKKSGSSNRTRRADVLSLNSTSFCFFSSPSILSFELY